MLSLHSVSDGYIICSVSGRLRLVGRHTSVYETRSYRLESLKFTHALYISKLASGNEFGAVLMVFPPVRRLATAVETGRINNSR